MSDKRITTAYDLLESVYVDLMEGKIDKADEVVFCEVMVNRIMFKVNNDLNNGKLQDTVVNRWIPLSERKPAKTGQYLVTKQQRTKGVKRIATAHYNIAFDEWSGNGDFQNVTAWMFLPEPYDAERTY